MTKQDREQLERLEDRFAASLGSLEERIEKDTDRVIEAVERINGDVRNHAERISVLEGERNSARFTPRTAGLASGGTVAIVAVIAEAIRRYMETGG